MIEPRSTWQPESELSHVVISHEHTPGPSRFLPVEEALGQRHERLQLIVKDVREFAIFTMDLDRRITGWNAGAHEILGYSREEIVGRTGDLIFTEEDRAAGTPQLEARIALSEGRAADERWHIRKDGREFWGSGVMSTMRDALGEPFGFVKIFRDQTEELRAKEALEQSRADLWEAVLENEVARREAEAANRAKDDFFAILSHELRTPLTPVLMVTRSLMRRNDLPADVHDALEMIRRNVQLEARFIDELLDLTRAVRGKLELNLEAVDLHEVIRHAVSVSASDIEHRQQLLVTELNAAEFRVTGDFTRLQQVFWNLLKNASKFSPDRGEIRLSTSNRTGWIIIQVCDCGIGIAPGALSKIFEPFVQADESVTKRFGGLGVGLALAKATVEGHRGVIRAASAGEGAGAVFTLELPLSAGLEAYAQGQS